MKKSVAIFFLLVYVISLTELNQLVKLPLLIEHFIKHKEKDETLSIWQFLDMHYAQGDVKDADYEEDMKLPFKSHDGCISFTALIFIEPTMEKNCTKPINSELATFAVYKEPLLPSAYLSFIWQPPKFSY